MSTSVTAFRMNDDLLNRYKALAEITGRTKTYYMQEALSESIDRLEYEYGILRDVEDYRSGKIKTYSLDEVREHCGLAD